MTTEAMAYLEWCLGQPLETIEPHPVSPQEVLAAIWSLNDAFRPRLPQIRTLRYDARFEDEADAAIIACADRSPNAAWAELSWGAWRVLLERHSQMIEVVTANWVAGEARFTVLPLGLSEDQQRTALMMMLLLRMKLPFPSADRSRLELPEGPAPDMPARMQ